MAALDFPNSPTVGQTFAPGGAALSYMWDGTRWRIAGGLGSPSGAVAYAQVTASQGSIVGVETAITGLSVTWTADPTRTYRVTAFGHMASTVAGDSCVVYIRDAGGTGKVSDNKTHASATTWHGYYPDAVETGLSGTQTRKVSAVRNGGSGTATFQASPTTPAFILVEDITYQPGGGGGTAVGTWNTAWGYLVRAGLSADVGNGTSTGEVAILTCSGVPYIEGRRVRITMTCSYRYNTPGDLAQWQIRRGSGTGGVILATGLHTLRGSVDDYGWLNMTTTDTMLAAGGSPTAWTFTLNRLTGGTGNIKVLGTVANEMTVEDVGPVTRQ